MLHTTLLITLGIFSSIILIYVTVIFLLSRLFSDNSIMDISYGPAFAVATWGAIVITGNTAFVPILVASLITIWALRLGIRIGRKNIGSPEDARYAKWRDAWCEKGTLYFIARSYLQINLLQGLIILIILSPVILLVQQNADTLNIYGWLGVVVWIFGMLYETTADWQLDAFIKQKKAGTTDKTLMTEGLFAFSRRPNYFGEATLWWGIAGIGIATLPLTYGWIGLLGPLCITYILVKVTGPMLEQQFLEKYPEKYRAYMETTNYLVPGKAK